MDPTLPRKVVTCNPEHGGRCYSPPHAGRTGHTRPGDRSDGPALELRPVPGLPLRLRLPTAITGSGDTTYDYLMDRSPNGTTPERFRSDAVAFEIAEARMSETASLDAYGMLGFDWMKAHRAVIDYANLRLYFKP